MIPYYDYLVKQGPKVKRTYSKSSGKLILKNGDDTLTAYVGKRTYYLNGVKKTFSVAPTKVKYYKTKKTIILIPANAIVKGLGLIISIVLLQRGSISHSLSFLQIQQHRFQHSQVVLCSIQITTRVYQLM